MRKLITTIEGEVKEVILESNHIVLENNLYEIMMKGDLTYVINKDNEMEIDDVIESENGEYRVEINGYTIDVKVQNPLDLMVNANVGETGLIKSPLTGVVSKIFVTKGDEVEVDTILLTISAMKMENKILSKTNGRVKSINVNIGDLVNSSSTLLEIE